jgi:hypothetical protein
VQGNDNRVAHEESEYHNDSVIQYQCDSVQTVDVKEKVEKTY